MENGSSRKDSIIHDWEQLHDYMKLYDMSENRIRYSSQPYVVPERLMTTFSTKSGRRFQDILKNNEAAKDGHRSRIEKMNYLHYMKSPQYDQKQFASIPVLENNMVLYLLYPPASFVKDRIKSIGKLLTAEIENKTKVMI